MSKRVASGLIVTLSALLNSSLVHAGGFSLYTEGSASAVGNYAAGIAAEAADASTGWYNPAGLVLIKKQEAIFSGVGVFPSTKLSGTSTYVTDDLPAYQQTFHDLQGGQNALLPAFHYVKPLNERTAFGVSVVSPFGLSTDWGTQSPVRYAATLTKLITLTVSPELSGQATENVSVGAGLDLQWARVDFNSVLGSPAALEYLQSSGVPVTPTTLDSTTANKGDSFGIGFHAGILGAFNDHHTRVGLNYQSKIAHTFNGTSTLTGRLADPELTNPNMVFQSNLLMSNSIELPDVLTLSGYQDVNSKLALLGSVVFTGWHSFKEINLNNVAAFSSETGMPALVDSVASENYKDTWRFAIGANYRVTDQWMMRLGGGYDQTPTVAHDRDIRLPDADRIALSIGSHYQIKPTIGVDIGYTYLLAASNANVNKTQNLGTLSTYNVNAEGKVHAQLAAVQVIWSIDKA